MAKFIPVVDNDGAVALVNLDHVVYFESDPAGEGTRVWMRGADGGARSFGLPLSVEQTMRLLESAVVDHGYVTVPA